MTPIATVQAAYAAFGRGDAAAFAATLDPAVAWHSAEGNPAAPDGGPWIGPAAVVEHLLVRAAANWERFAVIPGAFHVAGCTVVVEGRYEGLHRRTRRRLDAQVCHVWTVAGGRISRFQQYVDTAQLQTVLGDAAAA